MEKNIENYRKRLLLQFNSKKEKAGKEREALWNIICGVNADSSLNSHKKIAFEPIIESDSLQSYHQQRSAYPIGSYTNSARRFNDNNQFFTYHSYKMSSMANYAHNRAELRPDTKNVFDVAAIRKELSNANTEKVSTDSLNEDKSIESEEIAMKQEENKKNMENVNETSDNNDDGVKTSSKGKLNDVSNDNLSNEDKENNDNKNEETDGILFKYILN